MIRKFLNEETHLLIQVLIAEYIGYIERTWGSETSQYPVEKKIKMIPKVVASEIGKV